MQSFFPQWAQDLNTGLSFFGFIFTTIGLILTVWVTTQVNAIRRHYLAKGRLPDIIKRLEASGSALNALLQTWPNTEHSFRGEMKVAAAILKNACRTLNRKDGSLAREIERKFTRTGRGMQLQINDAWDIYFDVQSVIVDLDGLKKNMDWV